jgi:phosphonate transport system substrate-binding protein
LITGSHSNAIAALKEGHVDAAGCSLNAYEKAVKAGVIGPDEFQTVVVSPAIPNPPLAMHPDLPDDLKQALREAFGTIHEAEGINPEMIRGYGGEQYDRYDVDFPQSEFDDAMAYLVPVTDELVSEIVENVADTTR